MYPASSTIIFAGSILHGCK